MATYREEIRREVADALTDLAREVDERATGQEEPGSARVLIEIVDTNPEVAEELRALATEIRKD